MRRIAILLATLLVVPAYSQLTPTTGSEANDANSTSSAASDNLRTGRSRAPGKIVSDALATHAERTSARIQAQREGDTTVLLDPAFSAGSGSSGGSSGGLGGLLDGLLGGGGLGDLLGGNLGGLLGGLTGGNATGGNTDTGDDSDGNSNIPSNITPEVLQLLEQFGINPDDVFGAEATSKVDAQSQDTTPDEEEPRFRARLAEALLDQLFTSLAIGLRSPPFISVLADALRPILLPESEADEGA